MWLLSEGALRRLLSMAGFLVSGLWLTFGLGCVPTAALLVLGLVLWLPFPEVGRHLLRLAARVAWPLGTRVTDFQGRGSLRWVPLIGGTLAASAVMRRVDPDRLLDGSEWDRPPRRLRPGEEAELARALFYTAWILTVGWELCLFHLVAGLLLCVTVVGAPFGVRHLALAAVALLPVDTLLLRADERPGAPPRFTLRGAGSGAGEPRA